MAYFEDMYHSVVNFEGSKPNVKRALICQAQAQCLSSFLCLCLCFSLSVSVCPCLSLSLCLLLVDQDVALTTSPAQCLPPCFHHDDNGLCNCKQAPN